MRLFIAILLDENIKDALLETQREFRSFGLTGSYSPEENLHLTLSFIGEYDDPEEIMRAMEEARFDPFRLTLGGTGFFGAPPRDDGREDIADAFRQGAPRDDIHGDRFGPAGGMTRCARSTT